MPLRGDKSQVLPHVQMNQFLVLLSSMGWRLDCILSKPKTSEPHVILTRMTGENC